MTAPPLFDLSGRRALVTGGGGGIGLGISVALAEGATIEVNLTSVFELCRLAAALMVRAERGKSSRSLRC
jgi:NAD(P)-dependent dehydrogenase (short-subunit alcohol dehydrogenase family)